MKQAHFAIVAAALLPACVGYYGDGTGGGDGTTSALAMECLDDSDYCMFDDLGDDEKEDIQEGGCWITGGGHIGDANAFGGAGANDQDSFGFNAMGMKAGYVRGEIENVTHLGDDFHGEATWLRCWKDDGLGPEVPHAVPNNAQWGGTGVWNHEEGYTWEAHLADRAEGGSGIDEYEIWIYDAAGEVVYSQTAADDLVITGGNFQIHPPNTGHPYLADATTAP